MTQKKAKIEEKKIIFAGAFAENKLLPQIIRSCRILPQDSNERYPRQWIDEFGYTLSLEKGKNIISTGNKIKSSDLYRYRSPQYFLKNGRNAIIGVKDQNFIISFLGGDDFIRTYSFEVGELKVVSSLHLGLQLLEILVSKQPRTFFRINTKSLPMLGYKFFLLRLPIDQLFIETISYFKELSNFLNNGND